MDRAQSRPSSGWRWRGAGTKYTSSPTRARFASADSPSESPSTKSSPPKCTRSLRHSPYALALAVKQHEVALREGLEIMHAHYAIPHAASAWLAKQMLRPERDLKIITTLHGTDITLVGQDPSYFTLTKFSIEQSDAVTAVSNYLREETYDAFGCGGCDVRVIPNFISPAEYTPEGTRAVVAPPGHKVLIHVSNFRPVKRVRDVVRIFAGVRAAVPATLILAGDGPDRDAAEEEADRFRLGDDVRFLGKVDQVADSAARGGDLFLLPVAD